MASRASDVALFIIGVVIAMVAGVGVVVIVFGVAVVVVEVIVSSCCYYRIAYWPSTSI